MEHSSINYDIVYNNYARQIKSMKVGHIGRTGIKKIAKPVLLLALIKGIESGVFTVNRIEYEAIAEIYESVFRQVTIRLYLPNDSHIVVSNQPHDRAKRPECRFTPIGTKALVSWRERSYQQT